MLILSVNDIQIDLQMWISRGGVNSRALSPDSRLQTFVTFHITADQIIVE